MGNNVLDLHISFIENQRRQIEAANKLIECANGNKEVIERANELIESCKKCISIEIKFYNRLISTH